MLTNNSNVLVTGGAGFIGSSFIRTLLSNGSFQGKVINIDILNYASNLESLRSIEEDPRYIFIKEDINHSASIQTICKEYQIDLIVHFAAQTHVDRSIQSPACFMKTNIQGTFRLLEVVRQIPRIHFHHISTDEVFGDLQQTGSFKEDDPYLPNSPYSASKAASDHLVRAYHKTYQIKASISHSCNNYGPFQHPEKFIPLLITHCIEKKPLPIYGDGSNIREWIYVEEHSQALIYLLQNMQGFATYNIGTGQEMSNLDLVHLVLDIYAKIMEERKGSLEGLISFVPDRAGHDFRYALNTTKLRQLGFQAKVFLKEGIEKTIRWYLDNYQSGLKANIGKVFV